MSPRILALALFNVFVFFSPHALADEWVTLTGCRLADGTYADGDSFHVLHKGIDYHFRLYFVDTPETDNRFPDRVADQARHFGVTPSQLVDGARMAGDFTRRTLRGSFTIHTKWEDARGASRQKRFYAIVEPDTGPDLAAALVSAGLARSFGVLADFPNERQGIIARTRLSRLEDEARSAKRGLWGGCVAASPAAAGKSASPRNGDSISDDIMGRLNDMVGVP